MKAAALLPYKTGASGAMARAWLYNNIAWLYFCFSNTAFALVLIASTVGGNGLPVLCLQKISNSICNRKQKLNFYYAVKLISLQMRCNEHVQILVARLWRNTFTGLNSEHNPVPSACPCAPTATTYSGFSLSSCWYDMFINSICHTVCSGAITSQTKTVRVHWTCCFCNVIEISTWNWTCSGYRYASNVLSKYT